VSQTRGELPASFHPLLLWKKYASSRVLAYCGSFHHVTNVISKKNEARDQLVSPTKINKKKREGDHITETMGVAGHGR
jgi:hypothetical protein